MYNSSGSHTHSHIEYIPLYSLGYSIGQFRRRTYAYEAEHQKNTHTHMNTHTQLYTTRLYTLVVNDDDDGRRKMQREKKKATRAAAAVAAAEQQQPRSHE